VGALPPFGEGGAGPPKSPGPRPASIASVILIQAAIWSKQIRAENWGAPPLWGRRVGPPSNAQAYLHAKFHIDPSNRLATVHQRHRQDKTDRQRSDSIGRTVLQTVAQEISAVADERAGRAASRHTCCKRRWTFSVINMRPN